MHIQRSIVVSVDPKTMGGEHETFHHTVHDATPETALLAESSKADASWIIGAAELGDSDDIERKRQQVIDAWRDLERPSWPIILGVAGGLRPPRWH